MTTKSRLYGLRFAAQDVGHDYVYRSCSACTTRQQLKFRERILSRERHDRSSRTSHNEKSASHLTHAQFQFRASESRTFSRNIYQMVRRTNIVFASQTSDERGRFQTEPKPRWPATLKRYATDESTIPYRSLLHASLRSHIFAFGRSRIGATIYFVEQFCHSISRFSPVRPGSSTSLTNFNYMLAAEQPHRHRREWSHSSSWTLIAHGRCLFQTFPRDGFHLCPRIWMSTPPIREPLIRRTGAFADAGLTNLDLPARRRPKRTTQPQSESRSMPRQQEFPAPSGQEAGFALLLPHELGCSLGISSALSFVERRYIVHRRKRITRAFRPDCMICTFLDEHLHFRCRTTCFFIVRPAGFCTCELFLSPVLPAGSSPAGICRTRTRSTCRLSLSKYSLTTFSPISVFSATAAPVTRANDFVPVF